MQSLINYSLTHSQTNLKKTQKNNKHLFLNKKVIKKQWYGIYYKYFK